MELTLEAKTQAETVIKAYLEATASEELSEKINKGGKTIAGFMNYAQSQARNIAQGSCVCVDDTTVFGWAIHYFEEDSILEGTHVAPIKTGNTNIQPARKVAQKKLDEEQITLFDLFGEKK